MQRLCLAAQCALVLSTIGTATFWPTIGEPVALWKTAFADQAAELEWAEQNNANLLNYEHKQNVWVVMAPSEQSLISALQYGLLPMSAQPVLCGSQI